MKKSPRPYVKPYKPKIPTKSHAQKKSLSACHEVLRHYINLYPPKKKTPNKKAIDRSFNLPFSMLKIMKNDGIDIPLSGVGMG